MGTTSLVLPGESQQRPRQWKPLTLQGFNTASGPKPQWKVNAGPRTGQADFGPALSVLTTCEQLGLLTRTAVRQDFSQQQGAGLLLPGQTLVGLPRSLISASIREDLLDSPTSRLSTEQGHVRI